MITKMSSTCDCGGGAGQDRFSPSDKLVLMELEASNNSLRRQVQILTATVMVLQESIESTFGFPVINMNSIYYKALNGASLEVDNIKSSLGLPPPPELGSEEAIRNGPSNLIDSGTATNAQVVEVKLSTFEGYTGKIVDTHQTDQTQQEVVDPFDHDTLNEIRSEGNFGERLEKKNKSRSSLGEPMSKDAYASVVEKNSGEAISATVATFSKDPALGTSSASSKKGNGTKLAIHEVEVGKCMTLFNACGSEDRTRASHQVKNSRSLKNHKCSYCNASFNRPSKRKIHERIHTGEKPHKCTFCAASFIEGGQLKRHERTHTGEKPFSCSFCKTRFPTTSQRIIHERVRHTGEKPYCCSFCDKTFASSSIKLRHLRIHTNEKPYACQQCGKSFRAADTLRTHKLRLDHQQT